MAQPCRVEVSDRGERTKEERRGDSLVGGGGVEKKAGEEPGLTAPPAARAKKLQYGHVKEGGGGGGRRRGMTLTLTDHCSMTVLPSYEGSKDDKVGLKICFFALLHVWLCRVLSLYKDTFLCSMQIYSARRFYDTPPPTPRRLLTESAAHSRDFSFLSSLSLRSARVPASPR